MEATRSGKGKVAHSHPSPAGDGTGAPGHGAQGTPQETAAHPVSPDRVLIALERTEQGPCWGLLCGQVAVPGWIQGTNSSPNQAAGPLGHSKTSRPTLALTDPLPGFSKSCWCCLLNLLLPHQCGQGHCHVTPGSPVMGLSLGLHLCHSTENFPELLCSHSISSKLPSGACEDHEPAAASLSTLATQAPGVGSPQMSPRLGMWHDSSRLAHPSHLPRQCLLGL